VGRTLLSDAFDLDFALAFDLDVALAFDLDSDPAATADALSTVEERRAGPVYFQFSTLEGGPSKLRLGGGSSTSPAPSA